MVCTHIDFHNNFCRHGAATDEPETVVAYGCPMAVACTRKGGKSTEFVGGRIIRKKGVARRVAFEVTTADIIGIASLRVATARNVHQTFGAKRRCHVREGLWKFRAEDGPGETVLMTKCSPAEQGEKSKRRYLH